MENFEKFWTIFLDGLKENPHRDGVQDTPIRFLKGLRELMSGYGQEKNQESLLQRGFQAPDYDDWICLEDIPFASTCEHHLLPFFGTATIAYWPSDHKVLGLSKIARLVEIYSKRLQLQERLTVEIAKALYQSFPMGAIQVKMTARHLCMEIRGVKKPGIQTTTRHRMGNAPYWIL